MTDLTLVDLSGNVEHPSEIVPQPGYVLLLNKKQEKTASGLHIPESAQHDALDIRVHRVGEDVTKVKVGQRIMLNGEALITLFKWGKVDYAMCHEDDIIAILPEREPDGGGLTLVKNSPLIS